MGIERFGFTEPLRQWIREGRPVWGTCAGMILLAEIADGGKKGGQPLLAVLPMRVVRNHFGRQVRSFEALVKVSGLDSPYPGVFIRAPAVAELLEGRKGGNVTSLAQVDGMSVAVRRGAIL